MLNTNPNKIYNLQNENKRGFIALSAVVLITAILTLIIISISIQSIDETQILQSFEKHKQAQYETLACLDYILSELVNDYNYDPGTNLTISHAEYDINCDTNISIDPEDNTVIEVSTENEYFVNVVMTLSTTTPFLITESFEMR